MIKVGDLVRPISSTKPDLIGLVARKVWKEPIYWVSICGDRHNVLYPFREEQLEVISESR